MKLTIEERFLNDVSEHQITVIRDQDTDRHIRFRRPGTSCYGFDLITWPGHPQIWPGQGVMLAKAARSFDRRSGTSIAMPRTHESKRRSRRRRRSDRARHRST